MGEEKSKLKQYDTSLAELARLVDFLLEEQKVRTVVELAEAMDDEARDQLQFFAEDLYATYLDEKIQS